MMGMRLGGIIMWMCLRGQRALDIVIRRNDLPFPQDSSSYLLEF
jgi:hypothetical protein